MPARIRRSRAGTTPRTFRCTDGVRRVPQAHGRRHAPRRSRTSRLGVLPHIRIESIMIPCRRREAIPFRGGPGAYVAWLHSESESSAAAIHSHQGTLTECHELLVNAMDPASKRPFVRAARFNMQHNLSAAESTAVTCAGGVHEEPLTVWGPVRCQDLLILVLPMLQHLCADPISDTKRTAGLRLLERPLHCKEATTQMQAD